MNLRVKALLVIGTSMFLFLGLLLLIASPFLYNDSITLDESQTMKNVERLHNELDSEKDILFRTNRDWAVWDDSYLFVNGNTPRKKEIYL
ncbi:hypothetical protein ACE38V_17135 [Cytobacillus sp. Hz8]|uniref:hypothetical protein n=1 Tax=Cytobacillus sp. Hz8 TaxID=3347168 RepID=UPI0035DA036C